MELTLKRYMDDFTVYQGNKFLDETEAVRYLQSAIQLSSWYPRYQRDINKAVSEGERLSNYVCEVKFKGNNLVFEHLDTYNLILNDDTAEVVSQNKRKTISVTKDGLQTVFTPFDLVSHVITILSKQVDLYTVHIIISFNIEFVDHLVKDWHIPPSHITFFADSDFKAAQARDLYNIEDVRRISYDGTLSEEERVVIMPRLKKSSDLWIMNPPYQAPKILKKEKQMGKCGMSLWDKVLTFAVNNLAPDGVLLSLNPSAWRLPNNPLWKRLRGGVTYVEMHSYDDGVKVFGKSTRYDCIIYKNKECKSTTVVDETGVEREMNLNDWKFLPNAEMEQFESLIAKDSEPTIELLYDRSEHGTDKEWMSETQSDTFNHPCVYTVSVSGKTKFWYCKKQSSYYGIPKVIFTTGGGYLLDMKGEYGLTQFARGIVDTPENLPEIYKALTSKKWKKFTATLAISTSDINKDALSCLRKNFWKDFL